MCVLCDVYLNLLQLSLNDLSLTAVGGKGHVHLGRRATAGDLHVHVHTNTSFWLKGYIHMYTTYIHCCLHVLFYSTVFTLQYSAYSTCTCTQALLTMISHTHTNPVYTRIAGNFCRDFVFTFFVVVLPMPKLDLRKLLICMAHLYGGGSDPRKLKPVKYFCNHR